MHYSLVSVSAEFGTDRLQSLSKTSVGVFSLVSMLAVFGTWRGMLIGYGP